MKAVRIAALGAVLLVAAADLVAAQPPVGRRQDQPRAGGMARALLRDVQLTDAQRTQLRTIDQRLAEQRLALMKEVRGTAGSAARAQLRTRVQSPAERHRTEVRAILTPEQQRTFDANVARLRERGEARARR